MVMNKVMLILLALIFSANIFAAESTCAVCKGTKVEGMPGGSSLDGLVAITGKLGDEFSKDERDYFNALCIKYKIAQNGYDVIKIFKEIESSPYAEDLNKLWTSQGCPSSINTTMKVPFIYNTAYDAPGREEFPYEIYKYFVKKKKDPNTWKKLINTPTKDGFTFLDYIQYNIVRNHYSSTETMDAALRIVKYLCEHDGVYSKYKNTNQCN